MENTVSNSVEEVTFDLDFDLDFNMANLPPDERFRDVVTEEELVKIEEARNEQTTMKSTDWAVAVLKGNLYFVFKTVTTPEIKHIQYYPSEIIVPLKQNKINIINSSK